jgi:hypothetical protein
MSDFIESYPAVNGGSICTLVEMYFIYKSQLIQ